MNMRDIQSPRLTRYETVSWKGLERLCGVNGTEGCIFQFNLVQHAVEMVRMKGVARSFHPFPPYSFLFHVHSCTCQTTAPLPHPSLQHQHFCNYNYIAN